MEFLANLVRFFIYLSCSCMVLSSITIFKINFVAFGVEDCEFPAIFNFGDSNSDTGGLAAAFPSRIYKPYGDTFFHEPAGRFSDGRLIIDFIAKSFDLPYLSAYLDSQWTNFKDGANFATAASTIRLPNLIIPNAGYSPFYLDVQYTQFVRLKSTSQPKTHGEYFKRALYTFDIGQNDLNQGFFSNLSIGEFNASVPDIINSFSTNFKNIHNISGGRSFWIHNTGPIGCLPYILDAFPSAQKDEAGCAKPHNEVAQYFNAKLKEAVVQLRKEIPLAAITYVDVYSAKYSLYTHPHDNGFERPFVTCCGYGGKYNYGSVACGGTIHVNGTQIFVGSCQRPWARVIWDGAHYTEAANKAVYHKILTGAYSDPPLPLKKTCYKTPK